MKPATSVSAELSIHNRVQLRLSDKEQILIKTMKKKLFIYMVCLTSVSLTSCTRHDGDGIVVSAPFGPLVYPLVSMVERSYPSSFPGSIELSIWNNPDQLRAMIAGRQADFFAVPTNVAALFYNRGVDVKLINVSVWGVLWVVSSDSTKKELRDFGGEEIVMPFKGDMPHIVFNTLVRKRGLNPEKDFIMHFVSTPQDAVQQLIMGHAHHAVLAEPDVSILLYKSRLLRTDGEQSTIFYRAIDLQKEWGSVYHTGDGIPIGGIAIHASTAAQPEVVAMFQREYAKAVEWCTTHPEETAALVAHHFEDIPTEPIVESMKHVNQKCVTAWTARKALEDFFSVLYDGNPASIGDTIPGDGFYWQDEPAQSP